jgi:hypothetical protein
MPTFHTGILKLGGGRHAAHRSSEVPAGKSVLRWSATSDGGRRPSTWRCVAASCWPVRRAEATRLSQANSA